MFEHGSLHEVVDQEKEPCGCPPPPHPGTNEFPVAQSEGLAPLPQPTPSAVILSEAPAPPIEPLVYKSADHAPQPAAEAAQPASGSANPAVKPPATRKKLAFLASFKRFVRRVFGAE
jgi:hypothetical protein